VKFGVLGSGTVGRTIAAKLATLGHDVVIGTRDVSALMARTEPDGMGNEPFAAWHEKNQQVEPAVFADAASHGQINFNATSGDGSLEALRSSGDGLSGKVLIDITNPLDFSQGFPPTLSISNSDSLGEQIQREFPTVKVVKSLNTVTAAVMVEPGLVAGGDHAIFVSGDDAAAKGEVTDLLTSFGWKQVIDLGDITTARGTEMYLPLWLRLMGALDTPMFNIAVVR
jgi:8-hydroxy-5-deazaflavin:NADPH oxidoreductase